MSLRSKSNTRYMVPLSQSRSTIVWNKIRNQVKTHGVTCCQSAPLESRVRCWNGVKPLYTSLNWASCLGLSQQPWSQLHVHCNGHDLYVCLPNVRANGGVWMSVDVVLLRRACRGRLTPCVPKMKMRLSLESNTQYTVLLLRLRSAIVWNKIRNQVKTQRDRCRQSVPLEWVLVL